MKKILTVAVPSYNAEWCLDKCLSSFITDPISDRLEVIVVNDGSTDGTLKIANGYVKRFPNIFRVIDKPNGGHGSGINAAIKIANGKYFKVVDADDWVVTENIIGILDELEAVEADVVICSFQTVNIKSGRKIDYLLRPKKKIVDMAELMKIYDKIHPCCSIHGLMYLTEMYKGAQIAISENVFYDDNEFAVLPFAYVKSILLCPAVFYQYRVGNENQSVSGQNYVEKVNQLISVTFNILDYQLSFYDKSRVIYSYFIKKVSAMVISIYSILLVRTPDKAKGRRIAGNFNDSLKIKSIEMKHCTNMRYKLLRIVNFLNLSSDFYETFSDSKLYKGFRQIWGR